MGLDAVTLSARRWLVDDAEEAAAMLTAVGFRYDQRTGCWVHQADRRVITARTVAAHDADWLAHWITDG
jgi:hypothetical protein